MTTDKYIPEPLLFNPLKHYLPYIRDLLNSHISDTGDPQFKGFIRELKHIGTCVMDIYTGQLSRNDIFDEILDFLDSNDLRVRDRYRAWTGTDFNDYRVVSLSDNSQWMMKYHNNETRYVHIFPARSSPHTFRIKANTLKSAILYVAIIGKDYITDDDLNKARALAGLSPIKEVADAEAVTEMIEILRKQ